jgi:1-aminocyclopropane-1-carboxylate deaminase/D-cysteine desulfhydrase-like pyridoxal-dependent ACC family enzyme
MKIDAAMDLPKTSIRNVITEKYQIELELLRLDLFHPIISGNKYFKLKYNLATAIDLGFEGIISFGGAYSNHLHALAYAAREKNLKSIGIIRGEEHRPLNDTLRDCEVWGMQLIYISREAYRNKTEDVIMNDIQTAYPNFYLVPEGGDNALGQQGAAEIYQHIGESYDVICASVGTATTLKGIATAAANHQVIIGFSALKNAYYEYEPIQLESIIQAYHFGGYAKHNAELISFMKQFKDAFQVELDFIYTAKMMYGIFDLIQHNYFEKGTKLIAVHSGGLQGNRGLKS